MIPFHCPPDFTKFWTILGEMLDPEIVMVTFATLEEERAFVETPMEAEPKVSSKTTGVQPTKNPTNNNPTKDTQQV